MEVILKDVRLSFPDLWKRGKDSKDGKPGKFGATGIMAPGSDAFKVAKDAFTKAAQETFGANWAQIVAAMEKNKKCIREGNLNLNAQSGEIRPGFADMMYIVAKNKVKVPVVDAKKVGGQWVNLSEEDGRPYGGCFVNLKVDIYAMKARSAEQPAGVYATLKAVQFLRHGEAFGAGPGTADGFEDEGDEGEVIPGTAGAPENLF